MITPTLVASQYSTYLIKKLVVLSGELYGGTTTGELLKWDGVSAWTLAAPQNALYTSLIDIIVFNSKIFAVMSSPTYGNGWLLEWNGSNAWYVQERAGVPVGNTNVTCLCEHSGELYVGGFAFPAGGNLYKWDGNVAGTWLLVASTLLGETSLQKIVSHAGNVWVFTDNNGYLGENVAGTLIQRATSYRIGGTIPVGLLSFGGDIYGADTQAEYSLKKWDGASGWTTVIPDPASVRCSDLFEHDGEIFACSYTASGQPLLKWDGSVPGNWIQVSTFPSLSFRNGISFGSDIFMTDIGGNLYQIISNQFVLPDSISSSEAFGIPGIRFRIYMDSILSSEAWGSPGLGQDWYISLNGIASEEGVGVPTLKRTTNIESALSVVIEDKEGDIRLVLEALDGYGDVQLDDRDVTRDAGFETAVLITLGTDKRAGDEDPLPDAGGYKGGWWGDGVPDVPGDLIGWKGWILQRSKSTDKIVTQCKEYLIDGFQWMLDDGIVSAINIEVKKIDTMEKAGDSILWMSLQFIRPGQDDLFYKFFYNWQSQILRRG